MDYLFTELLQPISRLVGAVAASITSLIIQRKLLVHRITFEKKSQVFQELWMATEDVVRALEDFSDRESEDYEGLERQKGTLNERRNKLSLCIHNNRPFFDVSVYSIAREIRRLATQPMFKNVRSEQFLDEIDKYEQLIKEQEAKLKSEIQKKMR